MRQQTFQQYCRQIAAQSAPRVGNLFSKPQLRDARPNLVERRDDLAGIREREIHCRAAGAVLQDGRVARHHQNRENLDIRCFYVVAHGLCTRIDEGGTVGPPVLRVQTVRKQDDELLGICG